MSQLTTIILVLFAAVAIIAVFAIVERLRNQRLVDGGAFKGNFLLKSGKEKPIICKTGRETPQGVEILVPIPGKESQPTYYTDRFATFDSQFPGGKGIWNRIISVGIPTTTWYAGDPRPAIYHQSEKSKQESRIVISEIQAYLRDEKASAAAMQASMRNEKLELLSRNRINPNHALIAVASILITNIVAIYFIVQLQGDVNSMNNHLQSSMDAIRTLLGG